MAEAEPEIVQEKALDNHREDQLNEKKISKQPNLCGQKRIRALKPAGPRGKSKDDVVELWEWLNSDDDQKNRQTCSEKDMVTELVEEDAEIKSMFDRVTKRRKKVMEKSPEENGILVEKVIAVLEVAAEEDAELNIQEKPAIKKIQTLPLLTEFLSKKKFQQEFMDHGILSVLKTWLEPLPDGSLPNAMVRASILNILNEVLPIDMEREDRREQLKKSGLGKVVMFLSKSEEENPANRNLARHLTENWSRTIFNKSTRMSDLRNIAESVVPVMKPSPKKPVKHAPLTVELLEADLDLSVTKPSTTHQSCSSLSQLRAPRPEATPSVYLVRPQSNLKPNIHRQLEATPSVCVVRGKRRERIVKNLQRLKKSRKKPILQAAKVSAQGRGFFTYL
ncbi:hypothetical protein PTKIN_Ptkin16aG0042000 [Pterospermum kingtungense]